MASNQTANFGLNQWSAEDKVLREEFNADNAKIDMAIKAAAPIFFCGNYTGDGKYGAENPVSLTFDFTPRFIVVQSMDDSRPAQIILGRGQGQSQALFYHPALNKNWYTHVNVQWDTKSVSWYAADGASQQQNYDGQSYSYIAIG